MDARPADSIYLPTHIAGREIPQDPIRLKNLLSSAEERLAATWRRPEIEDFLGPADSGCSRSAPNTPASTTGSRWEFSEDKGIDLPQGVGKIRGMTDYEETHCGSPGGSSRRAGQGAILRRRPGPDSQGRIARIFAPRRAAGRASHQAQPGAGHRRGASRAPRAFPGDRRMEGDPTRRYYGKSGCSERSRAASGRHALIEPKLAEARAAAVDRLNALLQACKATTKPEEIVKAARYARVDTLFLTGDDHLWGWFDESEDRVTAHGSAADGDIDILDFVALMNLASGRVGDARRARGIASAGSLRRDPQIRG
jgi:hypothetical protein